MYFANVKVCCSRPAWTTLWSDSEICRLHRIVNLVSCENMTLRQDKWPLDKEDSFRLMAFPNVCKCCLNFQQCWLCVVHKYQCGKFTVLPWMFFYALVICVYKVCGGECGNFGKMQWKFVVKMEKTNTWVKGGEGYVLLCMIYINNPICLCCIFSTTYEANLKRNMRGHNPECDQCNYEGNHRANFECLVRSTHSNLWYQCVLCEFNASRKGNLNNHVQMKHEGVVFGCDDSDYKQSSKQ